jgi:hypothetical protein
MGAFSKSAPSPFLGKYPISCQHYIIIIFRTDIRNARLLTSLQLGVSGAVTKVLKRGKNAVSGGPSLLRRAIGPATLSPRTTVAAFEIRCLSRDSDRPNTGAVLLPAWPT